MPFNSDNGGPAGYLFCVVSDSKTNRLWTPSPGALFFSA